MVRLSKNDIINLHNMIKRGTFTGLEEAEVAVYLSEKLKVMMAEQIAQEKVYGSNVPQPNQQCSDDCLGSAD